MSTTTTTTTLLPSQPPSSLYEFPAGFSLPAADRQSQALVKPSACFHATFTAGAAGPGEAAAAVLKDLLRGFAAVRASLADPAACAAGRSAHHAPQPLPPQSEVPPRLPLSEPSTQLVPTTSGYVSAEVKASPSPWPVTALHSAVKVREKLLEATTSSISVISGAATVIEGHGGSHAHSAARKNGT